MGRYLLSIYKPDGRSLDPVALATVMRDLSVLNEEMRQSGVWVFEAGLQPPSKATVLRDYDGKVTATDGPYAETKEHIGGFVVIDVADHETALGWAGRLASTVGLPIELRPVADS